MCVRMVRGMNDSHRVLFPGAVARPKNTLQTGDARSRQGPLLAGPALAPPPPGVCGPRLLLHGVAGEGRQVLAAYLDAHGAAATVKAGLRARLHVSSAEKPLVMQHTVSCPALAWLPPCRGANTNTRGPVGHGSTAAHHVCAPLEPRPPPPRNGFRGARQPGLAEPPPLFHLIYCLLPTGQPVAGPTTAARVKWKGKKNPPRKRKEKKSQFVSGCKCGFFFSFC